MKGIKEIPLMSDYEIEFRSSTRGITKFRNIKDFNNSILPTNNARIVSTDGL